MLARQSRVSESIRKQVEENLKRTEENLDQTREVLKRTEETLQQITGGDSYCYLRLANETREAALLMLVHVGSATLYDISIRIGDFQVADRYRNEPPTLENLAKSQTIFNVGNLARQSSILLGRLPLGGTQRDFNIFITARNGSVRQLLRSRWSEDGWMFATRVIREGDPEQVLHEKIHPKFPKELLDW